MAENYDLDPRKGSWTDLDAKIKSSRITIIAALALTVVNVVLQVFGVDVQLLYAMTVPFWFVLFGKGMDNHFTVGAWTEVGIYTRTGLVLAVAFFGLAVLFWGLSFRNRAWMKSFLAVMILDTVTLLLLSLLGLGGLLDILVHGILLWQIIAGMQAEQKLERKRAQYAKKLEEEAAAKAAEETAEDTQE